MRNLKNVPLISVVIPSYNSAAYIEETLHSLAVQTFSDFEVIIIDDQSSDNTFNIAAIAHHKFGLQGKVIVRPDNVPKGVSGCRNLGIQYATAKWISFLDSDDLFLPEKIMGTVRLIDKYEACCSVYFHGSRYFEDGTNKTLSISSAESYKEPKDILELLTRENFVTTSGVTIKKSLIDEIGGFDHNLHGIEDYMLWLRAARRSKWYYSADIWTDYRVRKSSLMGGREMRYYVTQNVNLIKAVKDTKEFSENDIAAIDHYLLTNSMNYYSTVSLDVRGWGDFFNGLLALTRIGKWKVALILFKRHTGFFILKKAVSLKRINQGKK